MTRRKKKTNQTGIALLSLLIIGGAIFLVVAAFQALYTREARDLRDLRRLSDMREAETLFQQLFRETGGYLAAAQDGGCESEGALLSSCNASRINASFAHLRDPGGHAYRVAEPPTETAFRITFTLEHPHDTLGRGEHALTPEGIK
jgi:hypothetical protein